MKNDLHKTFGQIFDDDISAFRAQLVDIQNYQANRKEAEKWVERLRFLDISAVPSLIQEYGRWERSWSKPHLQPRLKEEAKRTCNIPITERKDDDGKVHYVAVSWRWTTEQESTLRGSELRPMFNYMIQRPNKDPHKSDFPDHYMERAIMFAQDRGITKLWVDKECIYQKKEDARTYPFDKGHGVQIMDAVYGDGTISVGLLSTPMVSCDEVSTLSDLLSKSIFENPYEKDRPKLARGVDLKNIQMVLLRILSDPRWSRGWM